MFSLPFADVFFAVCHDHRKQEAAGLAAGQSPSEMRRDALVKKVRGQREGDIAAVSGQMLQVPVHWR